MKTQLRHRLLFSFCALGLAACSSGPATRNDHLDPTERTLQRIDHVIVIYAENRSFDNLYGLYPGANGIANASAESKTQLDRDGTPFDKLPPVWQKEHEL